MRTIDIFFLIIIILTLFVIASKYYYSDLIPKTAEKTTNEVQMKYNFYNYQKEVKENAEQYKHEINYTPAISIPILLYHGITDEPYKGDILLEKFRDQMFALKKAGYHTITLEEFYKFQKGEINLPQKSILITFDDGIKRSFYKADPIFKALGFKATMFIITKYSLNKVLIVPLLS